MKVSATGSDRIFHILLPALFLLAALLALVAFGFMGVGRGGGDYGFDMRYLYVAGEMWERSTTPYDITAFKDAMKAIAGIDAVSYAYPPSSAPLAQLLSVGPIGTAQWLIGAINIACLAALALFIRQGAAITPQTDPKAARTMALIATAVLIGNPLTTHVVWMGQTTLVSAAFLFGAWLFACRRRDFWAGVLLGIGAFKPQLAFLFGFWFLLDRRWVLLAAAAATTVALSVWPLVATGLTGSWLGWVHSLMDYQGGSYNVLAFKHVFGIRSLLASFDLPSPTMAPVAILGTIALYWQRGRYDGIWLVNAVLILSLLFVYAHDYDIAPVAVIAFPLLMVARGKPAVLALICLCAATIVFPQRIWEKLDVELMARTREIALLGILAIYLILCRKRAGAGI